MNRRPPISARTHTLFPYSSFLLAPRPPGPARQSSAAGDASARRRAGPPRRAADWQPRSQRHHRPARFQAQHIFALTVAIAAGIEAGQQEPPLPPPAPLKAPPVNVDGPAQRVPPPPPPRTRPRATPP